MRSVSAFRVLVPPVLLAVGAGVAVALMITLVGSPADRSGIGVVVQDGTLVTGMGPGLVPATTERRTVRLTNTRDSRVTVVAIRAFTSDPVDALGQPIVACLPVVALVKSLAAPVVVPAGGTTDVEITIRLAATVQAQCRGLRFPLTYAVTAARAARVP
jgi:hypothetical protein